MKIHTTYNSTGGVLWEVLETDTETSTSRRVALCSNQTDAEWIVFALFALCTHGEVTS